jgi:hypothetical protein
MVVTDAEPVRLAPLATHCLAGAIGLELANVGIKIPLTPSAWIVRTGPAIVAMCASRAIFFQLKPAPNV